MYPLWITSNLEKRWVSRRLAVRGRYAPAPMMRKNGTAGERADATAPDDSYAADLEAATRGLLALNVVVLEQVERRVGLAPLRALRCSVSDRASSPN